MPLVARLVTMDAQFMYPLTDFPLVNKQTLQQTNTLINKQYRWTHNSGLWSLLLSSSLFSYPVTRDSVTLPTSTNETKTSTSLSTNTEVFNSASSQKGKSIL